jgi:hypothetical protein
VVQYESYRKHHGNGPQRTEHSRRCRSILQQNTEASKFGLTLQPSIWVGRDWGIFQYFESRFLAVK